MSYIRTHQFAKTFFMFLLGLPFVIGVFSNARPAVPSQHFYVVPAEHDEQEPEQGQLFSHIAITKQQA